MSLSLFFLLFSLFSFIFSFCTHRDEIRQTSDSTNYERPCITRSTESREELSICQSLLCHILGIFRVLRQIRPQAPLLVGLNVLSALTGFRPRLSQEILCIAKLMTANSSTECPTHTCGVFVRWRMFTTHATFIVHFRSCSMTTSLANDFAVVRLETKEGPFYYRHISGEEFIFYYGFK